MRVLSFVLLASISLLCVSADYWQNWDGRQQCWPQRLVHPKSEEEVIEAVTSASKMGVSIKTVGAGHSFSAIPLSEGVMLQLDALKSVLSVAARGDGKPGADVTVQAGIRVYELNNALLAKQLALPNTGAIAQQSIAGATQTSTHGTGKHLGSMATTIVGMRLILANGTILDVSEKADQRPDILKVARVGLGALGVVVRVTVRTVPAFKLRRTATPYLLGDLMPAIPSIYDQFDRMQWYWTPHTQNATLLLREPVPLNSTIVPCWPSGAAASHDGTPSEPAGLVVRGVDPLRHAHEDMERLTGRQLASDSRQPPALRTPFGAHPPSGIGVAAAAAASPGAMPRPSGPSTVCVDWSFKALAHPADDPIRYTEEEYFVPVDKAHGLIQQVNLAEGSLPQPPANPSPGEPDFALFTGMRYVAADDVALSPMNGQDIGVVSVITLGTANRTGPFSVFHQYADTLASLAKPLGGRWHWGKWNDATAQETARVYPASAIGSFEAIRRELDPRGLLLNYYLRERLPGVKALESEE